MLKFEVDTLEGLDESLKGFYEQKGERFRLKVEGIDPADELKEALRKERDERKLAKEKLTEYENSAEIKERERLEKDQQWETIAKNEKERADKATRELGEERAQTSTEKRSNAALSLVSSLTRDTARAELLKREALQFIQHTAEGVVISGPDGTMTAEQLGKLLSDKYPFLVDGNQSSGGGAVGSKSSGGAVKKFTEYTGAELAEIRKKDPALYDRLKSNR
jgi:hypothetical protein